MNPKITLNLARWLSIYECINLRKLPVLIIIFFFSFGMNLSLFGQCVVEVTYIVGNVIECTSDVNQCEFTIDLTATPNGNNGNYCWFYTIEDANGVKYADEVRNENQQGQSMPSETFCAPCASTFVVTWVSKTAQNCNGTECQTGTGIDESPTTPVELSDFTVDPKNRQVELTWQTASEVNNLGFEIERSSNARDWEKLSFVEGVGTSDVLQYYSFTDERPMFSGLNYYRLKQMDSDGAFKYSPVVVAQLDEMIDSYVQVYPNPSNGAFTLSLQNPDLKKSQIKLFDSTGNMIWEQSFRADEIHSFWQKEFVLPQYEVYFIVTQVGDQIETRKVTIIGKY